MIKQLVVTSLMLVASTFLFEYSNLDLLLQHYFYDNQSTQWLVNKDNVLLDLIFYSGFKKMLILFALSLLVALVFFSKLPIIRAYRRGLLIVLWSLILVPAMTGVLKSISNVPCPKQLQLFGGDYPYITFLTAYPPDFHQLKKARCFPAGHASGAFALMALYFLFKTKRNQYISLGVAIILGWITGGYKMLIGDHFFSHTLTTMLLAWLIIIIIKMVSSLQD